MNIFVTDPDPVVSAQCLPDKHVVKMPLETCQMLSIVASHQWGHGYGDLPKKDSGFYATEKGAFRNHPCTSGQQNPLIIYSGYFNMVYHYARNILIDMVRNMHVRVV